ncbi:MAG: EAL domain-containing protein [Desulfuromonadales bacterium]|nr:EAL domain-containing protein [Desulfuromonadales bacterium]
MFIAEKENSLRTGWSSPARIVLLYSGIGIAWSFCAGMATTWLAGNASVPEQFVILERVLFVVASSIALYLLVRHCIKQSHYPRELCQATFSAAPDAISINRLGDLSTLKVNDRFTRIFGYKQPGSDLDSLSPSALWNFSNDLERFKQYLDTLGEVNEFETVLRTNSGTLLSVVLSARIVELEGEACVVINIHDISRAVMAEEEAKQLAHYDQETGLPNHNLLLDRLNQIIALNSREGRCTAIIYINLTGFKVIEDFAGLEAGKDVLKTIARQMVGTLRQTDTVARVNREDFAIVLGGRVLESDISVILQKLQKLFEHPVIIPQGSMMLTAAFGVARFPSDGVCADSLLQNAHDAMDQARNSEANGFRFFSDSFNSKVLERRRIENDMLTGLESGEFFLCYQPKFDSSGTDIVGMEALVRWNQSGTGLMMPDDFIPIAEQSGFIVKLGEWILAEACRQNKKWHDEGLCRLRVSVNISLRQLRENDFVERVCAILEQSGLLPEYLELELTESVIMSDPDDTILKLLCFKERGIALSVDDFGTGYSSLSYLKHLPIDILKIDRSFVADINKDQDDEAIISAIILLAHSLKLRVVAEGVETQHQLDFLRNLQCNEFQGYLFSRPLHAEQFETLLKGVIPAENVKCDSPATVESKAAQKLLVHMVPLITETAQIHPTATGNGTVNDVDTHIGNLLIPVEPVMPSAHLPKVLNRFQRNDALLILPVVDNGTVVGMVNRLTFLEEHVIGRHGYGYHINHSRKIRELMSPPEITIDAGTLIDEAALTIQSLKTGARIENICITRKGVYAGLLDVNRFIRAMTERNLTLAKGANPLSGLPGNESIQRVINENITSGRFFDIAYIDIDNFKPYNDFYGFQKGDTVIKTLAEIICNVADCHDPEGNCFCGHIGGDDFILITVPNASPALAEDIIREFESKRPHFHGDEDYTAGCYHSISRKGELETFPLLSISIGIVNTRITPVNSYALLASLSTDVKKTAKKLPGSSVVVNRRTIRNVGSN